MGKMPTKSLGKSSELKLHCFCLFDAYSMPKDMCSVYGHLSQKWDSDGHFEVLKESESWLVQKLWHKMKKCKKCKRVFLYKIAKNQK